MSKTGKSERPSDSEKQRTAQAYLLYAISLILVIAISPIIQSVSIVGGLAVTEVLLILLPAFLFVHRKSIPVRKAFQWHPVSPLVGLLSILIGLTSWGVAAGIYILSQPILGDPPTVEELVPKTLAGLIGLLISGALLAGICEESLFRGVIQGVLSRNGQKRAVVIAALLFAVFHVNPWVLVPAFFLGIVFGTLVVRTGSTIPAILAHLSNNVMAFTVSYVYAGKSETSGYWLIGALAAGCFLTYPAMYFLTRESKPELPSLSKVPAAINRPIAWVSGIFGGVLLMLIVGVAAVILLFVGTQTVTDNSLEPDAKKGEQLVILKSGLVELDLEEGDIVSYMREGETIFAIIAKLDGESIRIRSQGTELSLPRSEIKGKVVHVIKNR